MKKAKNIHHFHLETVRCVYCLFVYSQNNFTLAKPIFLDIGSNNSGFYTLQAVLTHRGRSSSSGHYVAWVRWNSPESNERSWLKCDDDVITPVSDEEVLKLSGGGENT